MMKKVTRSKLFIEDLELPEQAAIDKDVTTDYVGEECEGSYSLRCLLLAKQDKLQ